MVAPVDDAITLPDGRTLLVTLGDAGRYIGWCGVGDIWIKRRLFHRRSREGCSRSASSTRSMVAANSLATMRRRRWMAWR
jgi:hypothetical protein